MKPLIAFNLWQWIEEHRCDFATLPRSWYTRATTATERYACVVIPSAGRHASAAEGRR